MSAQADPHAAARVLTAGAPVERAAAACILLHGRGGTARGILALAGEVDRPELAWLAPEAIGNSWYPKSFLAPLDQNEPWLSSALTLLAGLVGRLDGVGLPPARVVLAGFSQGGCLALEFAARRARRYGGLAGLAGGLVGPPGTPRDYPDSFDGTPAFLGCGDPDPHIPLDRVAETAEVLKTMGAEVTVRIYPGLGHTINDEEIQHLRALVDAAASSPDKERSP